FQLRINLKRIVKTRTNPQHRRFSVPEVLFSPLPLSGFFLQDRRNARFVSLFQHGAAAALSWEKWQIHIPFRPQQPPRSLVRQRPGTHLHAHPANKMTKPILFSH
ncbi:hypothetical protein, partial [Roseateles koreensis]